MNDPAPFIIPKSILAEAAEIRAGARASDYGDAVESFERVAELTRLLTGKEISAAQCCTVMMAVKLVRQSYKHKRDNLVDLAGYADILNLIEEAEIQQQPNCRLDSPATEWVPTD